MTTPRFLQIHTLQSYPAALLNRDDSGLAKRLPFGGVTRTRISSQCLKRHWRVAEDEWALAHLGVPMGVRSRETITRCVIEPLQKTGQYRPEILDAVGDALHKKIYSEKAKTRTERQPLLLGWPEVEYLRTKAEDITRTAADPKQATDQVEALLGKGSKANLAAMMDAKGTLHAGLEAALFGRMVTSDPAANTDAAIHVAHAFTVHREESESDYFSVCEDLREEDDDAGAAHINETELDSGLYYGFVVVDVPALVSNLEGCPAKEWDASATSRDLAGKVVQHLCHLIAKVSPGAKLGSTAPYAYARLTLIETSARQPRSLANAFREPIRWHRDQAGTRAAIDRLAEEIKALDDCYGCKEVRRFAAVEEAALPAAERLVFDDLAAWAAEVVRGARA
ncbi:CRISPR system Cascade subunit CasC [uncultured Defluviicoccus sp.]|uniref:CRISPR system Cascade subunit CasC n=1 Tax=metagenome TaxID=256318 RepID=A0A380TJV4_9ZZZZ|nr:CRISPR system Cascade subunit CasC [uncultured Defluviicoccus sp.]